MKYLGVRFDGEQCKTALLSYNKGKACIHELTSYPSKQAFLERKRKHPLVLGIAEQDVLIKKVNTPNNTHRILKKTLPFQVETQFEIGLDKFLFHPFSCFTDTTFVAASPKEKVDALISEYNPDCITTEQSALLHFAKEYAEEYHSLCIVYMKKGEAVCVLIEKGNYGRSVSITLGETGSLASQIALLMSSKRKLPLLFLGNCRHRKQLKEEFDKRDDSFQVVSLSLPEAQLDYALEIGLALEGARPNQMSIQYRKGERTPTREKRRLSRALFSVVFSLLFLAGVSHYSLESYYETLARETNERVDDLVGKYPTLFQSVPNSWRVVERIGSLKKAESDVQTSKRFVEPYSGFSSLYGVVAQLSIKHQLHLQKISYRLDSYPTVKKPREKYEGELHLSIVTNDPVTVKEFCEELLQKKPFENGKGITTKRDTDGFSIICSFAQ